MACYSAAGAVFGAVAAGVAPAAVVTRISAWDLSAALLGCRDFALVRVSHFVSCKQKRTKTSG